MTNKEFVEKAKLAVDEKTLYIEGCFGAPMNAKNKKRYSKNRPYNRQKKRTEKILNASADTFGFDCVCFVKGLIWGWNADENRVYGGATYASNGMPDTTINAIYNNHCTDQSTDFSKIEAGEFLIMDGHCGIYVGNGMAIEATPIWNDGVQFSEVWNIKKRTSFGRNWKAHAKLKVIEYIPEKKINISMTINEDLNDIDISKIEKAITTLGFTTNIYRKEM